MNLMSKAPRTMQSQINLQNEIVQEEIGMQSCKRMVSDTMVQVKGRNMSTKCMQNIKTDMMNSDGSQHFHLMSNSDLMDSMMTRQLL